MALFRPYSLLPAIAATATTPPFIPASFPLPGRRAALPPDISPPNLLITTLAGKDNLPPSQHDWPNPQRRAWRPSDDSRGSLNLTTLAVPFRQTDWPDPVSRAWRPTIEIYQPFLGLTTSAIPFNQTDWPNPQRRREFLQSQDFYIPFDRSVPALPFRQDDWPNPMARPYPTAALRFEAQSIMPPTPPIPGSMIETYFIVNHGRMMNRGTR